VSTREQTRAYYDQNVPVYDLKTGFDRDSGQTYNLERYYAPFLEASLPTSGRVLELGCGTGFYTRWLTERGVDVVAMDISPKMVEQARSRCPESASFAVGDCQDPAATLGMERVGGGLDGRMVMLDVNGNAFSQRLAYLVNLRGARIFAENINENTAENLRPLLQETGFEVETMTRFTFMPNAMNRIGVLLWSPFERVLAHLPLLNAIAIRIAWTARKVER
jgi:SAM-dependent methyltransferase